jgi:hypothetical protein
MPNVSPTRKRKGTGKTRKKTQVKGFAEVFKQTQVKQLIDRAVKTRKPIKIPQRNIQTIKTTLLEQVKKRKGTHLIVGNGEVYSWTANGINIKAAITPNGFFQVKKTPLK